MTKEGGKPYIGVAARVATLGVLATMSAGCYKTDITEKMVLVTGNDRIEVPGYGAVTMQEEVFGPSSKLIITADLNRFNDVCKNGHPTTEYDNSKIPSRTIAIQLDEDRAYLAEAFAGSTFVDVLSGSKLGGDSLVERITFRREKLGFDTKNIVDADSETPEDKMIYAGTKDCAEEVARLTATAVFGPVLDRIGTPRTTYASKVAEELDRRTQERELKQTKATDEKTQEAFYASIRKSYSRLDEKGQKKFLANLSQNETREFGRALRDRVGTGAIRNALRMVPDSSLTSLLEGLQHGKH